MAYEAKNFESLLGLEGLSDQLLKNHFTLYQGYVTNTNKLITELKILLPDKTSSPEFAEINRRFGWEFNGMRLHELYFGNLKKSSEKININSKLYKKIRSDFG